VVGIAHNHGNFFPSTELLDRIEVNPSLHQSCGQSVPQVQQKSQFRISMQTPVENPLMNIESFNRQFQFGEKEREAVKWGWEQEMGETMFYVVKCVHKGGPV